MSKLQTAVTGLLLLVGVAAQAQAPTTVLEGRVVDLVGGGAFILDNEKARTIVYFRGTAEENLRLGEQLRVVGVPVNDWMGMGEMEIQADRIERHSAPIAKVP